MRFTTWLDTFLSEKGIDLDRRISVEGPSGENDMAVSDVVAAMKRTTSGEQAQIKTTLVMIDFRNGDVLHFIKHLAQAIAI